MHMYFARKHDCVRDLFLNESQWTVAVLVDQISLSRSRDAREAFGDCFAPYRCVVSRTRHSKWVGIAESL